jgi:hypothetical protein
MELVTKQRIHTEIIDILTKYRQTWIRGNYVALVALIRQARVQEQAAGTSGGYAAIMQAAPQNARKQVEAMDAAPEDEYALGRKWAEIYNPHFIRSQVRRGLPEYPTV